MFLKCLNACKLSDICTETININYTDRLRTSFVLGWKDAVIECLVYNLGLCVWRDSGWMDG